MTREHTKCDRLRCREPRSLHTGADLKCPDGIGHFALHNNRGRASSSFSTAEIAALNTIVRRATLHTDLIVVVRKPEYLTLLKKIDRMVALAESNPLIRPREQSARARVLQYLTRVGAVVGSRAIAGALGLHLTVISRALQELKALGSVAKVRHGYWAAIEVAVLQKRSA